MAEVICSKKSSSVQTAKAIRLKKTGHLFEKVVIPIFSLAIFGAAPQLTTKQTLKT